MGIKRRLEFAGTLAVGVLNLIGCKTTIPEPVYPLAQAITQYDSVITIVKSEQERKIDEIGEKAKEQNTLRLKSQREEDFKPIYEAKKLSEKFKKDKAEFDKLCEETLFTNPGTSSPVAPSSVPARGSLLAPSKRSDLTAQIYLSSEERLDKEAYDFCGGGVEFVKPINKRFRWNAGMEAGNSHKNLLSPTELRTYNGDKLELYGGIEGAIIKIGRFELTAGIGTKYRLQEDSTNISDNTGDHYTKDTTNIPGIGAKASIKIGPVFIEREFKQYLNEQKQHDKLRTGSWKAGVGFTW